jgi:hypothetical protein
MTPNALVILKQVQDDENAATKTRQQKRAAHF